jgi:hypothetical protein
VPESISKLLAAIEPTFQAILATTKTHKWWWVGGGGGALAAIIVAVVVFGGFFGPSGRTVCTVGLQQAKDFGVISPSATLASTSAKSTDVADRKKCSAEVGEEVYVIQADIKAEDSEHKKCRDYEKQAGCIMIYSVARSDGMTTYQVREIPPDETDEAIEAAEKQAAESGGGSGESNGGPALGAGESGPGAIDTETSVDNSSGAQGGGSGQPGPQ